MSMTNELLLNQHMLPTYAAYAAYMDMLILHHRLYPD